MKNKFVNKEVVVSGGPKIKFELEKEHLLKIYCFIRFKVNFYTNFLIFAWVWLTVTILYFILQFYFNSECHCQQKF